MSNAKAIIENLTLFMGNSKSPINRSHMNSIIKICNNIDGPYLKGMNVGKILVDEVLSKEIDNEKTNSQDYENINISQSPIRITQYLEKDGDFESNDKDSGIMKFDNLPTVFNDIISLLRTINISNKIDSRQILSIIRGILELINEYFPEFFDLFKSTKNSDKDINPKFLMHLFKELLHTDNKENNEVETCVNDILDRIKKLKINEFQGVMFTRKLEYKWDGDIIGKALDKLCSEGIISEQINDKTIKNNGKKGPGRDPSPTYIVNKISPDKLFKKGLHL